MQEKHTLRYFVALVVAMIFWGIAWSVGKVSVAHADAHICAFWRYAISFFSLLLFVVVMKTPFRSDKKGYFYMFVSGLLTALFNYLFFEGVKHGAAGYGGTLVTALAPILTYILSLVVFRTKVSWQEIIAIFIGLAGAVILLKIPFDGFGFLNIHSIYFFLGAFVWSFVTLLSQKASKRVDMLFYTLVVFGITALINLIFALPYDPFALQSFDITFWMSIIFIGLIPGTFSTVLFFKSSGKVGAHNTAVFMFIVPIGAIVSSYLIYGEKMAITTVVGCILAFVAVLLFNFKRNEYNLLWKIFGRKSLFKS